MINARHELAKLLERAVIKAAWALPRRVAYWATIRVGANATTGRYGNQIVPELTFTEALQRWGERP